jgi:predicted XRE-type DNA-binding protein
MKHKKKQKEKIPFEYGSDNVFADLGFENPEEELLKADLTGEIAEIIKKKKLTQAQAARIMGITQPRVSSLLYTAS